MPSFVQTTDFPLGIDGGTYEGNAWRTLVVSGLTLTTGAAQVWGGVHGGGGQLAVTAPGGMHVQVGTGYCVVASSSGSTYGGYQTGFTSPETLDVETADSVNPRIDLVCMTVVDNGDTPPTSYGMVQIVAGTPASSPAAPALPANSLPLAQVTVPALATSIATGGINDVRPWTAASGGVVPVATVASPPPGHQGLVIFDRATGRFWHNPSGGPAQMQLLPFAPAMATKTSNVVFSGSETTVLSVNFTSPGGVDVKCFASWPGIVLNSGGASIISATMRLYIDSAQVATKYVRNPANDDVNGGGSEMTHYTSSATNDTPTAATHTLKWTMMMTSATANISITGAPYAPLLLRVEPVNL